MRRFFFSLLAVLGPLLARAEPLVTGFERFHAAEPSAEGGRLLYNELGCVNCHGGVTGLPARRGPTLAGVIRRVDAGWLVAYLESPAAARSGTTMPHLLGAGEALPVVHYLASLAPEGAAKPKVLKFLNAERGSDVFHTAGCVTCHAPGRDFQPPGGRPADTEFTYRSVPFPELVKKYSLPSLAAFLADPLKTRPDGRMPHVDLHESDAADVAAYLLDFHHSDGTTAKPLQSFVPDAGQVREGRRIVEDRRCAACHDFPGHAAVSVMPISPLADGCLSGEQRPGRPFYGLSGVQREALVRYIAEQGVVPDTRALATLTLQALNCMACHDRGGAGGPDPARKAYFTGDHNLGDTGLFPPGLTGVGRKLKPEWFKEVLLGRGRMRPAMRTQMPRFGKAVDGLPAMLAKADARAEKTLPAGDVEQGRKLFGVGEGNGCITCHRWGKRPSLGIQALDLSSISMRYQPGWLRDYLVDPAASRPGTLMPSFWPNGIAANQTLLGGDTDLQIASLLAFSSSGSGEPEGFPSTAGGEFELIPKERPVIQRTFLEPDGTHAILVGFPAGIHVAYDGKAARPVMVWRGRFFDAYHTWFTRSAPFEKPLGEVFGVWPKEPAAGGLGDEGVRFGGYRLDAEGVPIFLYNKGPLRVEERFEPAQGALHRILRWNAAAGAVPVVTHPVGLVVREEAGQPGMLHFIYTWK